MGQAAGNFGDIFNATSGAGLVNVNNTITGAGLIDIGSFDNQASGSVVASQSGYSLQIIATTLTNEGAMTADAGATLDLSGSTTFTNSGTMTADATGGTLDLGSDGATETLTNTGTIYVGGNASGSADLAISGNLTVTGSGTLYFKGAGADITSDGTPATFTNASTIEAFASGQIGDSNLTFDNSGTAGPSGALASGVTLTINTGANAVLNTGTLVAEDGATLAIVSNVTNQGTVSAGTSSSSSVGATTGTVDLGQDGGTGSTTNTGTIDIWAGSDLAISGNYTVTGSGYIGLKGAGADITSDGNAPATFTNASTIWAFASGQIGDQGILASNDLTFVNTGSVFASGTGVTLTLNTGGNTINDGGGTLEAESGAILAVNSGISGASGQIVIADGTFNMLAGSSDFRSDPIQRRGGNS